MPKATPARVRKPAVAGLFYSDNPTALRRDVQTHLAQANIAPTEPPKVLIAPHAGYIYSGPIAGCAYATLAGCKDRVTRVVLLGPSHRVAFRGLALCDAYAFATPLGLVPLHNLATVQLKRHAGVTTLEQAHAREHSLEVHLPFLQEMLGDFEIIPLVVGNASPAFVAEILADLWGGDETLIVVSTDLSHYHDDATARTKDEATARAIESLAFEELAPDDACGYHPLQGLLRLARDKGLKTRRLDLRNSGDTSGGKDQVVGYGAWLLR